MVRENRVGKILWTSPRHSYNAGMSSDRRFLTESGPEVFTGNELLVKGALECAGGVHLLGGYPGSPIAGYFDTLRVLGDLLREKGVHAIINNNEALAAAMLNGTQTLPTRAMIVIKSVGVHVAADALALGNLAGANPDGGAIVVYGDDPWSDSTQVPADSRYLSKHLFIPVIEPSNAQEVKDFVELSFKLSAASELFSGYVLTNNLADGGGTVQCRPNQFPQVNTINKMDLETASIPLNKRVLLPPKTWWQEENLADRFARAKTAARQLGLNVIEHPVADGRAPLGFVAAGLGHDYLRQALADLGCEGDFPICKLGMSYPVDEQIIGELAEQCRRIFVIEERRGFMEEQIAEMVVGWRQGSGPRSEVELYGKSFPDGRPGIPATRGLHPSILMDLLAPVVKSFGRAELSPQVDAEIQQLRATERIEVAELPPRLPSFCPGCPHRDSASLCLEIKRHFANPHYMEHKFGREPVDLLFHGDTGCYTMLMFPPNTDLMHDYSGMGLGAGTGSGTDPFVTNKEVVFMGDSTFYHSGQIAISQAIHLNQDITFIILDNATTAMTGHQPTPGVTYDLLGNDVPAENIESIVRGIAGANDVPITRTNPEQKDEYRQLLEETFLADGVKIIIADKECGITRTRRTRREERQLARDKGYLPRKEYMTINADVCRFCLACAEITGCPGLRHVETPYGPKMDTDTSWCVADGACSRVGACDSFQRVIVTRNAPPRSRVPELGLDEIPEPAKRTPGEVWRACLTGVGGMGIGLVTSILVRAGHREGYRVVFLDKKGLAIRNGGVVSQVLFTHSDRPLTGSITYGKADLLLGVDILEAARILTPNHRVRIVSKEQTAAVINTDKIATISGLMGREDYDPDQLVELIRQHTRDDEFLARNISRLCEKYLGSKIYANIMMLGYAFQQGLVPVSMHSIAWAIKDAIRVDFRKNLYAFNMGRKLVESPELFQGPPQRLDPRDMLESKLRWAARRYGKTAARVEELRSLGEALLDDLTGLDDDTRRDLVVRLYDAMRWGGIDYARQYADRVRAIYTKDRAEYDYQATRAVVQYLADAMLIKDSIFTAELGTSPESRAADREKYNVNPANGDGISYRHLWKRKVRLFGRDVRFNVTLSDKSLGLLKRSRWARPILAKLSPWLKFQLARRDKYIQRVDAFSYRSADEYRWQLGRLLSPACMGCDAPSCKFTGCPLGSDVPDWVARAEKGDYQAASAILHETNNFPEFTSRLCPAFCEKACHRTLTGSAVKVRDTEGEIIDRAWEGGYVTPQPAEHKTGRTVAVVGSGPAGLAAAQQLARAGHEVTVFEADDAPGGLLRYGIPQRRLAKDLIDRRVEQLTAEGVSFRTAQRVGQDTPADALREQFDAVLLAVGAQKPRDLAVPGRSADGVVFALDFLRQGESVPDVRDKAVVVIGGGLTGEDCVETALAHGAREVHQLEILPQSLTPAQAVLPATPDGVCQHWAVATKAFLPADGNGHIGGLQAVRLKYTPSPAGPQREELPGSEFTVPAELAVLAMGFEADVPEKIATQLGLEKTTEGKVRISERYATSVEGIFAAGDVVTGPAYVATAIDSGRRAAAQVHAYLKQL
jgi:indolepyruvate ferredoxin oxidoreductase